MNFKNMMLIAFTMVAMSLVVFSSTDTDRQDHGCQKVKGTENGALNPDGSGATGFISHGGRLNGPTRVLLATPFTPTGDPFTFSFTDNFTLTTNEGVLRTHNVSILDTANGVGTAVARIDPTGSEGVFNGATGVLFLNSKVTNTSGGFQAEITGEICYADN